MSELVTKTHLNRDGTITFERVQDMNGILKSNQIELINGEQDRKAMMRKVATIPNIIIEKWMKEGINIYNMGHDPDVRKKVLQRLNSFDYRSLRTHNSRL